VKGGSETVGPFSPHINPVLPGMAGIADSLLTRFSPGLPYACDSLAGLIKMPPYKPGFFRFRVVMPPQIIGIMVTIGMVIPIVMIVVIITPQIIRIYSIPGINRIQAGVGIIQAIAGTRIYILVD
jgi:hypothetical protein